MAKRKKSKQVLVEIARSFSYKLNIGNFQSADFFCSKKMEVPAEEAENVSKDLFAFCLSEVELAVKEYQESKRIDATNDWSAKKQELYNNKSEVDSLDKANAEADIEANKIF